MIPNEPALPRQIDQNAEHEGEFWVETFPKIRMRGKLRFKKGLSKLTLRAPIDGQDVFTLIKAQTLHGELRGGIPVTLWNRRAWPHKLGKDSKRWQRFHLTFDWALIGSHEPDYENARFSSWAVRFRSMATWSRLSDPLPTDTPEIDLPQHPRAHLTVEDHSLEFILRDPQRITEYSGKLGPWDGHRVHILVSVEPAASPKYLDIITFDLQALMTFSYQRGAFVTAEYCSKPGAAVMTEIIRKLPVGRPEKSTGHSQMVLTPESIGFDRLITGWWAAIDDIYPVTQVLSKEFYLKGGLLEASASSAIAAAERMHDAIGPTTKPFAQTYLKAKRDEIRELFHAPEDAAFLQHLLDNTSTIRPSLGTRLRELADFLGPDAFDVLQFSADEWIATIKTPRNKLAHTGSHVSKRDGGAKASLFHVDAWTRAVLSLVTLKRLGVPAQTLLQSAWALRTAGTSRLSHQGVDWRPEIDPTT